MNFAARFTALVLWGLVSACASAGADTNSPDARAIPRRGQQIRISDTQTIQMTAESGFFTRNFAESRDLVWVAVNEVYLKLEIPLSRRNARTFELGHDAFKTNRIEGSRMGKYVDCGHNMNGSLANNYDITLSILTRVSEADGGLTSVATNVQAVGMPRATSGNPVSCNSTLALEKRIIELVNEMLGMSGRR